MVRSVVLLATLHEFQGLAKYPITITDPEYTRGVESCLVTRRVDFVFEEAAGLGPSIAEDRSDQILGRDHYLDIDSGREKPNPLGGVPKPIFGFSSIDIAMSETRENEWFRKLNAQRFNKGLVICGMGHSLSFGFKLQAAGFIVEICQHLPFEKLCKKTHVEVK